MSIRLSLQELRALAEAALIASRTTPCNAHEVALALVAADADGLSSHGVSRVPAYADQALAGKVDGEATPAITQPAPSVVHVDARRGFAYPAITAGLARGSAIAAVTGLAAVAIARSHHFGAAGYHAERAAQNGLVALVFGNTPAAIAPWGGSRPLFGTNPIACAFPRRDCPPLVIDLSLSKVARGKVMIASQRGQPIPEGWALDTDGQPTTDPKAALAGTMLPMGDAKGAALVLMVELLAAALTGSNYGYEASSFFDAKGPAPEVGQLLLLFDPRVFAGEQFAHRVEALLSQILAQPGARLPGERRLAARALAQREGIELTDTLHSDLQQRAQRTG
ncbi:MAG: Ldh family oxidoreductase [Acidiferrobacteraceae bacterium]